MKNVYRNHRNWMITWKILFWLLLLAVLVRFGVYYLKTDGFSGISLWIPLLLVGSIIFGLLTSGCCAAWVYEDCKKREDDNVLWPLVVFIATPLIGLLLYFLRRTEITRPCVSCGHRISLKANFCEECGAAIENKEVNIMENRTHHLQYIFMGMVCMVLMICCLTVFVVSAAKGEHINSTPASGQKVLNMGVIRMSFETKINGIWKLKFKSASDGFVKESNMRIRDYEEEVLYADIKCKRVPEDATLTLWIVQDEKSESIDVTNLESSLEYPLNQFKNGKVHIRLQINGVEDVESVVYIK